MKNNLDNFFKNSLQNYEEPYDPKAWEELSSKLGSKKTPKIENVSTFPSILKWISAGLLIGVLGVGTYFLTTGSNNSVRLGSNNDSKPLNNKKSEKTIAPSESEKTETLQPEVESIVGEETTNISQTAKETQNHSKESTLHSAQKDFNTHKKSESESQVTPVENESVNANNKETIQENKEVNSEKYIAGQISSAIICEGEQVVISNSGRERELVEFQVDGEHFVLRSGKSFIFKPMSSTEVYFTDANKEIIETKEIKVLALPTINFTYESNIFEKGLPVTICKAYGDYSSYIWTFNGESNKAGAKVKYHFFNNGDNEIGLKVIDKNGCENAIVKTVHIAEKYNLMAVDAFRPDDVDQRNRTFMPYSLTERDVAFQLVIIDPVNNETIFTSNSVDNAWDGTDQKTGKMTPIGKTFVWKVQIFNPLPNEKPVYTGTVVHK